MKNLIITFVLLATISRLSGQQTHKEVINTASAIEDTKLNSDTVPKVYAISGQFERILVLRFKYQTDLLLGLDSVIKQQKIRNAVILSGIGSVRGYHFHMVSNRSFPSKNVFVKDPLAPADIANMNGYIINGRVHAHIIFSNEDKAFGGHLEAGTEVFTFAIVTIGVLNGSTDLSRVDDKNYR